MTLRGVVILSLLVALGAVVAFFLVDDLAGRIALVGLFVGGASLPVGLFVGRVAYEMREGKTMYPDDLDERPQLCEARQQSDQKRCERCNLVWDMNDPEPPECLTKRELGLATTARLRSELGDI